MDERVGGLQLPQVVQTACFAWFQAANIGTWSYAMLTMGNANLLLAHGSDEQVDAYVRPMIEGRFHGTMCLSEPQAGSSLADITTRAEPRRRRQLPALRHQDVDLRRRPRAGREHRPPGAGQDPGQPAGGAAASRCSSCRSTCRATVVGERNDVVLAGLNHKMGYRGTVNTVLNFGEAGARRRAGWCGRHLVGEDQGLAAMFHMMNEARIGGRHGRGGARLHRLPASRSTTPAPAPRAARRARRTRAAPPVPLVEHADVRRMLLAQKAYVEGGLGARPVLRQAPRRGAHRRDRRGAGARPPAARRAHADREELAVAVVPAGQRPRDPGPRRLRLHPRVRRRAALPRQPAQPDPRGHARDPGARPARPQGRDGGRRPGSRRWRTPMRRRRSRAALAAGGEAADLGAELDAALTRLVDATATIHGADLDPAARAGQRVGLPGGRRARGGRVGLARAVPRHRRSRRRLPPGQTSGRPVLLPLRAAADRAEARPARPPRPDDVETDPGWL